MSSTTPTNFAEMSDVLGDSDNDSLLSALIKMFGTVHSKAPCFFLWIFNKTKAKDIALKIVKSALKSGIQRQPKAVIDKVKKSL